MLQVPFFTENFSIALPSDYAPPAKVRTWTAPALYGAFHDLEKTNYIEFIAHLQHIKNERRLNDWLFFLLVHSIHTTAFDRISPAQIAILNWFVLSKSGYDARLAYFEAQVFLYVGTRSFLFEVECVAALTAGFPVTIASNQGFANRTDESGILAPSGTWFHQMFLAAIRFKENAPPGVKAVDACLVVNSWGTRWLSYAGKYPSDQPDGSFWAERPVIERILAQGDSYAIGDVQTGFEWRDIHHGRWLQPADNPSISAR